MPFKLPNKPSPQPHIHELADFAELLAWTRGKCSVREIQSYLGQIDDNQHNIGIEDDDVENENLTDAMMLEISIRSKACAGGYPFCFDSSGSILSYAPTTDDFRGDLYLYLLMATRLNMQTDKVKSGIDGTDLLEELSSEVLRYYLGYERARSMVFGTAVGGSFRKKVDGLCKAIGEGGLFQHIDAGTVNANDDSLDVVGWTPFADQMPSKLSVFGQCKTGTSWDTHKSDLRPDIFIKRWMSGSFVYDPERAFFITESADRAHWSGNALYTGLLFDRCRIVDCTSKLESDLLVRIQQWTQTAKDELLMTAWGVRFGVSST